MINTNKIETSERPKCSADTKYFLSDMYTNSTQTKKAQVEMVQSGRSMIEMLGVLAIVGVLSVGGIAGYSKAMMQFKINKTIDHITQIATTVRTLYAQQTGYGGYSLHETLKNMNALPDEIKNGWQHILGGSFYIDGVQYLHGDDNNEKAFSMTFESLPKEACIKLATYDWGSGYSSGLVSISVAGAYSTPDTGYIGCEGFIDEYTATACPGGSILSTPMPVTTATEYCKYRQIVLKFK